MIIGDILGRRAKLTPDKVALIDTLNQNRPITYGQWSAAVYQTANWLQTALGIRKGERVAVLAMNCVEYLDIWLACGRIGAILQNLNWRLTAVELSRLLAEGEPAVLVYGPDFAQQVDAFRREKFPSIRHWVALAEPANGDLAFRARLDSPAIPPPPIDLAWDDPWVICYTSGATGTPKGAVLSHRALVFNAINTHTSWGLAPDDVAILNMPLFHTDGLNLFTLPLVLAGGASIVCRTFDIDQLFDLIATGSITLLFGTPTIFILLQQHPRWEKVRFSELKLVIVGGAPCPLPVFARFWARSVDFKSGYGLTEAGPNTFWLPPEDVRRKPGYAGFPLLFVEVKIVSPSGRECRPGQEGELLIRGPHLCAGYWRNPAATGAAIHPTPADPSGRPWLHTGDVAVCDEEGYYRIVGRLQEIFVCGGENVYPAEVESVLHGHSLVAEAAVIAVPDNKWGEVGRALIVLRPALTERPSPEALIAYCRERLAGHKVPHMVLFVETLPKTGAGRINKRRLVREFS